MFIRYILQPSVDKILIHNNTINIPRKARIADDVSAWEYVTVIMKLIYQRASISTKQEKRSILLKTIYFVKWTLH